MTLAGLLLLAALGQPFYTRPATPADDLQALRAEIAVGKVAAGPWHEKVRLYLQLGELGSISELAALLAQTFPDDPIFLEARMIFLSYEKKHGEAIALGEELLRRFPAYPTLRANLGRVYLEAGDRARGVNLLIAALEQGPIRVEDWNLLLEGLGLESPAPATGVPTADLPDDDKKAAILATLRKKVAENPQRPSLRYLLLVVLTRLGRYDEARALLRDHPELLGHPDLRTFFDDCCGDGTAAGN